MPLDSLEMADKFREHGARPALNKPAVKQAVDIKRPEVAGERIDRSKAAEDGPEAAYERQKAIERAAYDLARAALKRGTPDAARMIQVHAQAAKNLTDAREQVLKLLELEQSLVSGAWIRKVMLEHDGAAVTLIRTMPKQMAGRICPHDPEFAEGELDRWVNETFLKTMHDTDPWRAKK